jgi:hypothetical protein
MSEEIKKVPRPAGFGTLTKEEKYLRASILILTQLDPFRMGPYSGTARFRQMGIPTHVWKKALVEKLAEGLEERSLQLGGLYHLHRGSDEIDSLADYLTDRIINTDREAHPLLIKELNSVITNRARLSEAFTKLAQMLKESGGPRSDKDMSPAAILQVIREAQAGRPALDKDSNQKQIENTTPNPLHLAFSDMEEEVSGTPDLEPIPMSTKKPKARLNEKPKELPTMSQVIISPL